MKAYVLIKIRTGEIPEAVKWMRKKKNIKEANMTFGPYDAVAIVEVNDLNELGNVIAFEIQSIPGIMETLTCLAVDI
jgi:DNA-binding Lrp family transcriptional regulator